MRQIYYFWVKCVSLKLSHCFQKVSKGLRCHSNAPVTIEMSLCGAFGAVAAWGTNLLRTRRAHFCSSRLRLTEETAGGLTAVGTLCHDKRWVRGCIFYFLIYSPGSPEVLHAPATHVFPTLENYFLSTGKKRNHPDRSSLRSPSIFT